MTLRELIAKMRAKADHDDGMTMRLYLDRQHEKFCREAEAYEKSLQPYLDKVVALAAEAILKEKP